MAGAETAEVVTAHEFKAANDTHPAADVYCVEDTRRRASVEDLGAEGKTLVLHIKQVDPATHRAVTTRQKIEGVDPWRRTDHLEATAGGEAKLTARRVMTTRDDEGT